VFHFGYDPSSGDLLSISDPLGNVSYRFSDPAGRLILTQDPLGNTTNLTYSLHRFGWNSDSSSIRLLTRADISNRCATRYFGYFRLESCHPDSDQIIGKNGDIPFAALKGGLRAKTEFFDGESRQAGLRGGEEGFELSVPVVKLADGVQM
jgi:YD repeat-containing protein